MESVGLWFFFVWMSLVRSFDGRFKSQLLILIKSVSDCPKIIPDVRTLRAAPFWYFPCGRGRMSKFHWAVKLEIMMVELLVKCCHCGTVWRKSLKCQSWQTGQRVKECWRQGIFYHFLPLTCWRQTGRGKVSQWETLSAPQSFLPKTWRPFVHPNHSYVCIWRSCLLKVAMDSSQCSKSSSKSLVKQEPAIVEL